MTRRPTANWPPLPAQAHTALSAAPEGVSEALTGLPGTITHPGIPIALDESTERTAPNAWRNDRFNNRTNRWESVGTEEMDA